MDEIGALERIAKLKADGVLSEQEFEFQKSRILGTSRDKSSVPSTPIRSPRSVGLIIATIVVVAALVVLSATNPTLQDFTESMQDYAANSAAGNSPGSAFSGLMASFLAPTVAAQFERQNCILYSIYKLRSPLRNLLAGMNASRPAGERSNGPVLIGYLGHFQRTQSVDGNVSCVSAILGL